MAAYTFGFGCMTLVMGEYTSHYSYIRDGQNLYHVTLYSAPKIASYTYDRLSKTD